MITNRLNLPQPFVDAATSDYKPTEGRYSVTRVLGSPCEAVLLRRHGEEIDGDVADYVWKIFGSAVHKILEESQETDTQIKENYLKIPVLEAKGIKYELSGKFDLYDDSNATVTDYKTAPLWKIKFANFEDWRMQTLLYCWMLRQIGFDAKGGEIVALIKDFNKRDALKDPEYPQHPVYKIGWDFSEEEIGEAGKFIRQWFEQVVIAETLPDEQLTPCTEEQRWAKPEKWAVIKKGVKRATRVLDSQEEANELAGNLSAKYKRPYIVEHRPSEDTKCEGYCDVRRWCPYYQAKVNAEFWWGAGRCPTPASDSCMSSKKGSVQTKRKESLSQRGLDISRL